jgi:pyruvate/2-oxoacid:ferredoxin oxidoreductase alpha subunit/Pyruvate/2-oxoacid:ferredoxin oxidoreductase gamma subunit
MSTPTRYAIKIAGESGSLSTAGNIVIDCLRHLGFYVYCEREFPSLIKGGRANIQINFAKYPIRSLSHKIQVGVALDREGVLDCLDTLGKGSIMINGFERWQKVIKDLPTQVEEKGITLYDIPAREITEKLGGSVIMVNTVLVGFLFKVLGLELEPMILALTKQLAKKPDLLEINKNCAKFGYEYELDLTNKLDLGRLSNPSHFVPAPLQGAIDKAAKSPELDNLAEVGKLPLAKGLAAQADWGYNSDTTQNGYTEAAPTSKLHPNHIFIDGNSAICLGALQAGCRAHYQYPMSPSTTVLTTFASWADKTGMLVKQAEDEITAIQMALGSMHTGTRAMTATSGGGFDLMTETISLAGMIETPVVCVIVQRPGPATGLPTWTGQADLNLAIHSGHGEYGKLVIACSDVQSCYENIQHAFDLAEKFQIPVMLLSEANIGMSSVTVPQFQQNIIPINRYLVNEKDKIDVMSEVGKLPLDKGLAAQADWGYKGEAIQNSDATQEDSTSSNAGTGSFAPLKMTDLGIDELTPNLRYQITESGVSHRWIPGTDEAIYFANGDEHHEDGSLDESLTAGDMIAKRVRKLKTIEDKLPEPEIFSSKINSYNQNEKVEVGKLPLDKDKVQQGFLATYCPKGLAAQADWGYKGDKPKQLLNSLKSLFSGNSTNDSSASSNTGTGSFAPLKMTELLTKKSISFLGWGSTKSTILDAIDQLSISNPEITVNYLHFNYMFPLKTTLLKTFLAANPDTILIEGNATGQLGELIAAKTGFQFQDRMLKWNGRPFYVEEIVEKVIQTI